MGRRQLYVRYCKQTGAIILYHVDGDKFQLADIGTKGDIVATYFDYKCSILEAPFDNKATKVLLQSHQSRRGVLESSASLPVTDGASPSGDVTSCSDANAHGGLVSKNPS